ncbi:hypothetical protein K490DRAFT_65514 [Saccharata proteae CBS 121410]|uniref:Rhodopsin domain-containing protein n=1 Tax=Saccharata proteae CBS 121410 TaxID=1314787 RepID=A0A9P4HWF1_9PEZI|nr:hypothetical protein K490DRAFT_65514 [Saccharata proteae CBS 121410]
MIINHRLLNIQLGAMVPLMFFATTSTMWRFYTGSWARRSWPSIEETFVIIACNIGAAGCLIVLILELCYGSGVAQEHLDPSAVVMQYRLQWVVFWIYTANLLCIKLSIVLLYRRVFSQRIFVIVCDALIGFITITTVASMASIVFFCLPVNYFWNQHLPNSSARGHCINWEANWLAFGAVHVATNLAIVFLPAPVLLSLQLPRREKIFVAVIFGFGIIPVVAAIMRLLIIRRLTSDFTVYNNVHNTWIGVEMATAIFCCNLPSAAPLLRKWFPGLLGKGERPQRSGDSEMKLRPTHLDAVIRSMCEKSIYRSSKIVKNKIHVTVEQIMYVERIPPGIVASRDSLATKQEDG